MQQRASRRVYWDEHWSRYRIEVIQGRIKYWPGIGLDSADWFWWLEQASSFSFQARDACHFTARKEKRARGGAYWVAYRHVQGKLRKKYIAPQAHVTTARLEQVADELEAWREKADEQPQAKA